MPPDGEQAVPRRTATGELDPSVLYMTVPLGASPSSTVRVKIANNLWDVVTVPPSLKAGDVMQLNVTGRLSRKRPRDHAMNEFSGGEGEQVPESDPLALHRPTTW